MTCDQVQAGGIVEKYLLRELNEADSAAFEVHYFQCADCLKQVEMLESMRKELQRPPSRIDRKPRWIWPSLAAALFLAAILVRWSGTAPSTSPTPTAAVPHSAVANTRNKTGPHAELELLARFTPPPYRPALTRAAAQPDLPFEKAMEKYVSGDFSAAAQALTLLPRSGPSSLPVSFYLGIAKMQLARPDEAAKLFTEVIGYGDTLFLEQARLYRAKAYLQTDRVAEALDDLRLAVALHGDWEAESRELIRRLEIWQGLRK